MERNRKQQLQDYFDAPPPDRKRAFMRQLKPQKVSHFYMLKTQFHYISKTMWLVWVLFFIATMFLNYYIDAIYVGSIYALIPFWAMTSIAGSMRSYRYGMQELELSARFSLKSVVLARMNVLGICNMVLLLPLLLCGRHTMLSQACYLLVPYLITATAGLMIIRSFHGSEGTYLCFGFSALISMAEISLSLRYSFIYELQYVNIWIVVCIICLIFWIQENYRTIRMTEELIIS